MYPLPPEQETSVTEHSEEVKKSDAKSTSSISSNRVTETTVWEDRKLVERVIAGDQSAIEELLIHRCGASIAFTAAKFKYGDKELLSDLHWHLRQEDWRRLRSWKGESSIKRWVETVAVRICLKRLKDSARFEPLEGLEDILPDTKNDPASSEKKIAVTELLKAIEQLKSARERLVMRMFLEGKDLEQIVDELKITRGNVDTIKSRAIPKMRRILNGGGSDV